MAAFRKLAILAGPAALAVVAMAAACSSNNTSGPPVVYQTGDGGDATAPPDTGSSDQTSPPGDAGEDTKADVSEAGDGAACTAAKTDAGCYVCPNTASQFLNQCSGVGVQCTAFNNATRLPNYDGGLPPLN